MGDVAMLVPIVYAVARANPQHRFTLLTQPFLTGLLVNPPENLEAMALDTKADEGTFMGLLRYAARLRSEGFDAFIDLHDVIRTKVLRWHIGCLSRTKTFALRKPRCARRALLNSARRSHPLAPVPSMLELYRSTFLRAGLSVPERISPIQIDRSLRSFEGLISDQDSGLPLVGIAPFASTDSKTYDLLQMEELVGRIGRAGRCVVMLFGGRGREAETLNKWAERYPRVHSVAGQLDLPEELALMSLLSCMVSMDSANMHLAAAVGTRVISVWCATHPYAGFLGLGQSLDDCVQDDSLDCRPCSIFGRVKQCVRGDMPCRRGIDLSHVHRKVEYYTQTPQGINNLDKEEK